MNYVDLAQSPAATLEDQRGEPVARVGVDLATQPDTHMTWAQCPACHGDHRRHVCRICGGSRWVPVE